jgi:hypothetical protein
MALATPLHSGFAALHDEFEGIGSGYLAACTNGLPPASTVEAATVDLDLWRSGSATPAHYDVLVARARTAFAAIAGVDVDRVALGSQTSV